MSESSQAAKDFFDQGVKRFNSEDIKGAANEFTQSIEIDPNYTDALVFRGMSYILLERLKEATQDFSQAINIDPGKCLAFFGLPPMIHVSSIAIAVLKTP